MNVQTFLDTVFKDLSPGARPWVTGFRCDPYHRAARWGGVPVNGAIPDLIEPDANNYMAVSSFKPGDDGRIHRRKANFSALHLVMLDDIGTKVSPDAVVLDPSYLLETSPDNYQAGYLLTSPVTDRALAKGVVAALVAQGLAVDGKDPGMKGVTRYGRLPMGINNKPKLVAEHGQPFKVRLAEWEPARRYTLEEIIGAYKLKLGASRAAPRPDQPYIPPLDDSLLTWLASRGQVQGPANAEGWIPISCPWLDEHSDRADTGAAYLPPHGFKCHHGHCENRNIHDLRAWAKGQGWAKEQTPDIDPDLAARCGIGPAPAMKPPNPPEEWLDPTPLPTQVFSGAKPYPLENLPPALQKAVEEVARFNKVPPASPAIVGQSIIALAIGKQAIIEERGGLEHHPSLFLTGIADSGERKSPVVRHMTHPLEEWIDARQADYEARAARVKANHQTIDSAIHGLKKAAAKAGADLEQVEAEIAALEKKRLPPAIPPRMFTTDPTEQRLFQLMEVRGGAYGVISGEGRPVFDAILGKYSGDGMNGDAIYLAGISGDTITRDRVGNINGPESRYIRRPCLNVAVMVQPDKYLEVASHPALRESGAIARIWPAWFPSLVGTRLEHPDEPPLDAQAMQSYNKLIYDLLNAQRDLTTPHRVTLSQPAAAARREVHNAIEQMMQANGDLADVKDIASKAISQMTKLALVYHLAHEPGLLTVPRSEVALETWEDAQTIGLYHLQEAVRVQRLADADTVLGAAHRILAWICRERCQTVTTTTLMQFSPRPRPTASEADAILEILSECSMVRASLDPARRKPVWTVNPKLFSRLANLASMEG